MIGTFSILKMKFALLSLALALSSALAVEPLRVDGVVTAVMTPFGPDGMSVNHSVVPLQAAWLKATGVKWAFVGGEL